MTIEVALDVLEEARFPDRCILCGCAGPGDWLEVSTRAGNKSGGWFGLVGRERSVLVPSCSFCRHLMQRQRRMRNVGLVIASFASLVLYGALYFCYRGEQLTYVRGGGLLLFLMPYLVWEGLFPLPFRLRSGVRSLRYGFEQVTYARAFALLNLPPGHSFFRELMEEIHE
jgi:hypothetical protein